MKNKKFEEVLVSMEKAVMRYSIDEVELNIDKDETRTQVCAMYHTKHCSCPLSVIVNDNEYTEDELNELISEVENRGYDVCKTI